VACDERGMHFNKGKSAIVILYPITKTREEHPDSHFLIFLRREGFGKLQQSVFHHGSVQVHYPFRTSRYERFWGCQISIILHLGMILSRAEPREQQNKTDPGGALGEGCGIGQWHCYIAEVSSQPHIHAWQKVLSRANNIVRGSQVQLL